MGEVVGWSRPAQRSHERNPSHRIRGARPSAGDGDRNSAQPLHKAAEPTAPNPTAADDVAESRTTPAEQRLPWSRWPPATPPRGRAGLENRDRTWPCASECANRRGFRLASAYEILKTLSHGSADTAAGRGRYAGWPLPGARRGDFAEARPHVLAEVEFLLLRRRGLLGS